MVVASPTTKGRSVTEIFEGGVKELHRVAARTGGVSTVFVIENGKVRPQNVTLGAHQGNLIEILDGLKGSETLASSNLSQLAAGVPVTTRRSQ